MSARAALYLIFLYEDDGTPQRQVAPVPEDRLAFLLDEVVPRLEPAADEVYLDGLGAVLRTAARFSYVLRGDEVFWCIEWEPGLLVLRSSPAGGLAWAAMRSPVPDFAGRTPTAADLAVGWHEDDPNPCYELVFDAWDAQFDALDREDRGFRPATPVEEKAFEAAVAPLEELERGLEERMRAGQLTQEAWTEACTRNLAAWAGEGHRPA